MGLVSCIIYTLVNGCGTDCLLYKSATLAMCLNALHVDPGRPWKGPWRWYSEELLDSCTSLQASKQAGIDFEEFTHLAR